jgi:hypothetical protein
MSISSGKSPVTNLTYKPSNLLKVIHVGKYMARQTDT